MSIPIPPLPAVQPRELMPGPWLTGAVLSPSPASGLSCPEQPGVGTPHDSSDTLCCSCQAKGGKRPQQRPCPYPCG